MRRSVATALLLLMLAAFVAPAALATAPTQPASACCRAAGRHHCFAMVPGESGPQIKGQRCPYRKLSAFSASAATARATQAIALADEYSFLNDFYSEVVYLRRELPHLQRGPPIASSPK